MKLKMRSRQNIRLLLNGYCVVKRYQNGRLMFFSAKRQLGTKMMATGEVMAIGNSFEAALLKGVRSLEIKQFTPMREFSKQHSLEA